MSRTGKFTETESRLAVSPNTPGGKEYWGLIANEYKVSVWGDEMFQKLHNGDSCRTLVNILKITKLHILKGQLLWCVNHIKLKKKNNRE